MDTEIELPEDYDYPGKDVIIGTSSDQTPTIGTPENAAFEAEGQVGGEAPSEVVPGNSDSGPDPSSLHDNSDTGMESSANNQHGDTISFEPQTNKEIPEAELPAYSVENTSLYNFLNSIAKAILAPLRGLKRVFLRL